MSSLRRQLDSLRRRYATQRYPGDLASQLLGGSTPRHWSIRSRWVIGGIGSAVATGLALAVFLYDPATSAIQDSVHRLARAADLPFLGLDDEAAAGSGHFSIIPEFRGLDVPAPPDATPQPAV